jgi:CRP-like cAMP-binding protein
MNIMETVLFLESVDIFKQNNLDDLTALAAITKERTFHPGEHILSEGEPGEALYIITRGRAEIVKKGKKLLAVQERGSLGSVSLLDKKPHAADAIAATECETLVIDRVDFMDLVADRVELLHGIFLALTDRLRALLAVTEEGALAEEEYDDGPTNPL